MPPKSNSFAIVRGACISSWEMESSNEGACLSFFFSDEGSLSLALTLADFLAFVVRQRQGIPV